MRKSNMYIARRPGSQAVFWSADAATKIQVAGTADKLIKAGVQNMVKARQRMDGIPQLPSWHCDECSVASVLEPFLARGCNIDSLQSRKFMRDCINTLYVSESQTEHAARCGSVFHGLHESTRRRLLLARGR